MNQLEYELLTLCNFDMSINEEKYFKYIDYLTNFDELIDDKEDI